jgi:hypothetical protein
MLMWLKESMHDDRIINKVMGHFMRMPELEFIAMIKEKLNYDLEPIRKNQYIVK